MTTYTKDDLNNETALKMARMLDPSFDGIRAYTNRIKKGENDNESLAKMVWGLFGGIVVMDKKRAEARDFLLQSAKESDELFESLDAHQTELETIHSGLASILTNPTPVASVPSARVAHSEMLAARKMAAQREARSQYLSERIEALERRFGLEALA